MTGRTARQLRVGQTASFSKTISASDVYLFAGITGDLNPVHIDRIAAESSPFGRQVVHGMLTASLISTVLGQRLPGPGAIYVSQTIRFLRPVFFDDTVTATVVVKEVDVAKNRVLFATRCTNERGEAVAEGESVVMPRRSRGTRRRDANTKGVGDVEKTDAGRRAGGRPGTRRRLRR